MAKSSRRSIDALFVRSQPTGVEDLPDAKSINVDLLDPNPFQPRKTFDDAALVELADDIEEHGVLQPLLVRPHPQERGRYQIAAGERRWRAARLAGLGEVPCIERDMDNDAMERLALVENIQRADLDPVDEAHAYNRLIEKLGLSQRDLAASVHKDHEYIAQRLRLIEDPRIETSVRAGKIGPTVGQELARVTDTTRRHDILDRADRGERITVKEVKGARVSRLSPRSSGTPVPVDDKALAHVTTIEETSVPVANNSPHQLEEALGTLAGVSLEPLFRYGIAREWTCEELWQAIQERRV